MSSAIDPFTLKTGESVNIKQQNMIFLGRVGTGNLTQFVFADKTGKVNVFRGIYSDDLMFMRRI